MSIASISVRVESVTGSSVTVSWRESPVHIDSEEYQLYHWDVLVQRDGSTVSSTTLDGRQGGDDPRFSATLSGLSPNTSYTVVVRFVSEEGDHSNSSASADFTTSGDGGGQDCDVPTNMSVSLSVSGTSATASASADGEDYFEMRWFFSGAWQSAFRSDSGSSTKSGLSAGEQVCIQARAVNDCGHTETASKCGDVGGGSNGGGTCECDGHGAHAGSNCEDHNEQHSDGPPPTSMSLSLSFSGCSATASATANNATHFEMRWYQGSQGWLNSFNSSDGTETLPELSAGEVVVVHARACNDNGCTSTMSREGTVSNSCGGGMEIRVCNCGEITHVGGHENDCQAHIGEHGGLGDDPEGGGFTPSGGGFGPSSVRPSIIGETRGASELAKHFPHRIERGN